MVDISLWMEDFLHGIYETFGERIWFVGLQGSYGRGEATSFSDIDVVVIFDVLQTRDLEDYRQVLDQMPNRELICGFVSGKEELLNWEPADLFQFYFDTTPWHGSLDELLPLLNADIVNRTIRIGAGHLYHGCVHNLLHSRDPQMLKELYKGASFVLQALAYRQTGRYYKQQKDLREVLNTEDRQIADTAFALKNGAAVEFDRMSQVLFAWTQGLLIG